MRRASELLSSYSFGSGLSAKHSDKRFVGGGHYGIEVSSINNYRLLQSVLSIAEDKKLKIHRVDQCRGIFRLVDAEIIDMVALCAEKNVGLVMSVGPRAIYDTGGFSRTANGARIGYRLRGMRNFEAALDDVLRAVELGVRGFLIYDEGLLNILGEMRAAGLIPVELTFKLSVHAGCSNPASARLFERVGADSINLVPDLEIHDIAAIRAATSCPMDVFSDTAKDAGGMIRTHEVGDIIRYGAPVYIKCGASSQPHQNHLPSTDELSERMNQVACVYETIARDYPSAEQVGLTEPSLGIPVVSKTN